MNAPINATQLEIFRRVMAIPDPKAECKKRFKNWSEKNWLERWPDGTPKETIVEALWKTDDSVERGLRAGHIPGVATEDQLKDAYETIYRQALINDEYRRG